MPVLSHVRHFVFQLSHEGRVVVTRPEIEVRLLLVETKEVLQVFLSSKGYKRVQEPVHVVEEQV